MRSTVITETATLIVGYFERVTRPQVFALMVDVLCVVYNQQVSINSFLRIRDLGSDFIACVKRCK